MKASWFRSGLLLGFFAAAVPVKAREPIPATLEAPSPGFLSGERIRLRLPSGVRYSGRVVSADDSCVTVAGRDGLVLKVDRRELSGVEVSQARGRGEGALRGSLKGAALGALLGGFVYAVDQGSKRPDGLCGDLSSGITRCTTGSDVFSMTAGTALLGAALGALHPGERWLPVKPDALRVGLGRAPGGGVAVRASLSF